MKSVPVFLDITKITDFRWNSLIISCGAVITGSISHLQVKVSKLRFFHHLFHAVIIGHGAKNEVFHQGYFSENVTKSVDHIYLRNP